MKQRVGSNLQAKISIKGTQVGPLKRKRATLQSELILQYIPSTYVRHLLCDVEKGGKKIYPSWVAIMPISRVDFHRWHLKRI